MEEEKQQNSSEKGTTYIVTYRNEFKTKVIAKSESNAMTQALASDNWKLIENPRTHLRAKQENKSN